ncbi:MAG: hypothetical protein ACE5I3_09125 [Phycisphaerae bacterium]
MKRTMDAVCILSVALLAGYTAAYAQDPVGTVFTYQGQLKEGGIPANGDYDFVFRLFDDPSAGSQVGGDYPVDDWLVIDGLFTVQLDFGTGVFTGDALWLEVSVRPGASGDTHTVLSPRQPLTATPYALYALDGPGSGGYWTLNGDDIYNNNPGGVGIGTTSPASMLDVQSTEGTHGVMSSVPWIAVWAHRTATTGTYPAIHGECDSLYANGSAIRGIMTSTSPGSSSAGVRGINNGTGAAGIGVYGSQDGSGYGVYGSTPSGTGVYGSGGTGVYGSGETGVYGSGETGVYGSGGIGVYGVHPGSGTWPGVWGESHSTSSSATAVRGIITSTSPGGSSTGVLGVNNGTGAAGIGVWGRQDGSGYGVYGSTPSGRGVYGSSTSGWGVYGAGGLGGGYFEDSGYDTGRAYVGYGNIGIEAYGDGGGYFQTNNSSSYAHIAFGGTAVSGWGGANGGTFGDLDSSGTAYVGYGTYKIWGTGSVSFVQNHPDDADNVIGYACPEGDEVATYTRGTARLLDGEAVVPLGETFKWVTNPDIGLTAHLTPRAKGSVLYVESLSTREMLVRSMDGFPDDIAFDYIVYGLRIGFEEVSIVQEKDREAYIPSMADHRELYERRPELREYNALERFRVMGAAVGETEPADLSAAYALRDAIVEFDPAVHELPGGGRPAPDDAVPAGERDDSRSAVDPDTGDEPIRPSAPEGTPTSAVGRFHETLGQKDGEIEALRARLDALEALVAELRNTEDGGAQ